MADEQPQVTVVDDPDEERYRALVDGAVAGSAFYHRRQGRIVFLHTEVDPQFEGHGVGSRLAREALDEARAKGLRVVPRCPFIARYIKEHPEYQALVD